MLGLIFAAMGWWRGWRAEMTLARQQRVMGERIAMEHDGWTTLRAELETLRKENENLRLKVADLNRAPMRRAERDLETIARAVRKMIVAAPGFAQAWENAKKDALDELEAEERGKSLPRRLYEGIVGGRHERLPTRGSDAALLTDGGTGRRMPGEEDVSRGD